MPQTAILGVQKAKGPKRRPWIIGGLVGVAAIVALAVLVTLTIGAQNEERAKRKIPGEVGDILATVPLIDGHNDLAYTLRKLVRNSLENVNLDADLRLVEPWKSSNESHTDIPRLHQGGVGAQFWSAYTQCDTQYKSALSITLEQIDVIRRFVDKYPQHFKMASTANDIVEAHAEGKIASMIGVEGGHSIDSSLGILRIFYELGVRYMTLTHNCNTPWADNNMMSNITEFNGLSDFGKLVVAEMNRIGMIVDLSHVAFETMHATLDITTAPVIFSHSGAYGICNHTRNVPDDVLHRVKHNGGVVMVTFVPMFLTCSYNSSLADAVRHMEYIKNLVGVDHVGIGGDYNGIPMTPVGLEDVSKYPDLLQELLDRGWTRMDLEKVVGRNLLRVIRAVEKESQRLKKDVHSVKENWIEDSEIRKRTNCSNN